MFEDKRIEEGGESLKNELKPTDNLAPIFNLIREAVDNDVDFIGQTFSYIIPGYDIAVIIHKQEDEEEI
jgi:hypothetical protein